MCEPKTLAESNAGAPEKENKEEEAPANSGSTQKKAPSQYLWVQTTESGNLPFTNMTPNHVLPKTQAEIKQLAKVDFTL